MKDGSKKDPRKINRRDFVKTVALGGAAVGFHSSLTPSSEADSKGAEECITLSINGRNYELEIGERVHEVKPSDTLAYTIRKTLGLTGTKVACDHGSCGACTVLMDGKPIPSCMVLTVECAGKDITTIEGLQDQKTGKLDPLQEAFIENGAFQCGFCTPGMIMSAKALLTSNPSPSEEETKEALSGNHCRCISHYHVIKAVREASRNKG